MFVNSTCECTNLYLCPGMFLTLSLHHVSDDPEERHHRLWKTGVNAGDREGPCDYKPSLQAQVRSHTLSTAELCSFLVIHVFNDVILCQFSKALYQKPNLTGTTQDLQHYIRPEVRKCWDVF